MITLKIGREKFREDFGKVLQTVTRPRALMAAVGRDGANQLKKHFRQKDKDEPNRLGGKRDHFWLKVMRSTQNPVVSANGNRVSITVSDPRYAQKLFGGVIRAKRVKNLAIPQTAEAYGRSPSVFEKETGLKLIFIRSEGANRFGLLATRRSLSALLQIEYVLKPSVNQRPDPTAFPDEDKFEAALLARANTVMDRQLKNPSATQN